MTKYLVHVTRMQAQTGTMEVTAHTAHEAKLMARMQLRTRKYPNSAVGAWETMPDGHTHKVVNVEEIG